MSATATQTTTPTPTNPDHDERGRFARGNKGGPGNPYARHTAALRKAAAEALTPQHIQVVMLAMWELAAKGDKEAARIVLAYGPGKPQPGADPDSLDAHEMRNYFAQIVPMPAVIEMMKGMPLQTLLTVLPHVMDARERTVSQQILDGIPKAQEKHKKDQQRKQRREERKRKWLAEREQRRAERRRQHEQERNGARPSPNGDNGSADAPVSDTAPSSNGGNGQATYPGAMPTAPLTNGGGAVDEGEWVPESPSTNGDIDGVSAEEWEDIMRGLLGPDYPPPLDEAT